MLSTIGAVNDESELAGVAGELTAGEAVALAKTTTDPVLLRLLRARGERPEAG